MFAVVCTPTYPGSRASMKSGLEKEIPSNSNKLLKTFLIPSEGKIVCRENKVDGFESNLLCLTASHLNG